MSLTIQSYYTELLFLNGLFQNNYLKKIFSQKTKLKYMFEVPVYVASLTEPVSLCVFEYYRKIKENSHSL